MQIVGAFAEFERAMLRERIRAGLDAARKAGRIGGRRPKLNDHQQQEIKHLVSTGQKPPVDAARLFNAHPVATDQTARLNAGTVPLHARPPPPELACGAGRK